MIFDSSTFGYRSHKAVYIGPEHPEYTVGETYDILLQELSDKRIAAFKSSRHYNEPPGYKLFANREEVNTQFQF